MARLAGTSVPVPTVRWLERDPATLGGAFYVMDAVDGEVPSEVPSYHVYGWVHDAPPERRTRIWWHGVETMARVHALDWRALGLGFLGEPSSPRDAIDRQLAYWDRYLALVRDEGPPQPTLDATPRLAARQRLHAAAGGAVLGRLAPAEHDVPRRSGGGGARLGDGVPGRPRGRSRLVVLPRLGQQRGLRRPAPRRHPGHGRRRSRATRSSPATPSSRRTGTRCSPPSATA